MKRPGANHSWSIMLIDLLMVYMALYICYSICAKVFVCSWDVESIAVTCFPTGWSSADGHGTSDPLIPKSLETNGVWRHVGGQLVEEGGGRSSTDQKSQSDVREHTVLWLRAGRLLETTTDKQTDGPTAVLRGLRADRRTEGQTGESDGSVFLSTGLFLRLWLSTCVARVVQTLHFVPVSKVTGV